ncbi:hypothetical protein GU90_16430 [Saccharopolyspora rectivirgula]|uniref:Uncharacterized protein n=1 Tax=Saccharopolyspora rectivirgula TaxID=28042 RepID=A0A073AVI0_9PSEU|nr:hypothetical protein GU90_16430 [Saccharopolyspora rectivirgula]
MLRPGGSARAVSIRPPVGRCSCTRGSEFLFPTTAASGFALIGFPHPEFFGTVDAVAEMAGGVLHPDEGEAAE